jgi:electron transfer flavoprotein beta subunit
LKILVCIKQVPDPNAQVTMDPASVWFKTDEQTEFCLNRFDECAIEEALLIREAHGDTTVDVISVGPPRASAVVKRAMGMGCDHGIHILTHTEDFLSPFVTAAWIAALAGGKKYGLIFTGMLSEDLMQGQVGVIVSELLDWPCAMGVVHERLGPKQNKIEATREIEGGARQRLEIQLPAVLAIQTGINQPRYPSLSNLLKANRYKIETVDSASFTFVAPRQNVVETSPPPKTRSGRFLTGTLDEKARALYKILNKRGVLSHDR